MTSTEYLEALVSHSINIVTSSGKKIGDIIREKRTNHNRPNSQFTAYWSSPQGIYYRRYFHIYQVRFL